MNLIINKTIRIPFLEKVLNVDSVSLIAGIKPEEIISIEIENEGKITPFSKEEYYKLHNNQLNTSKEKINTYLHLLDTFDKLFVIVKTDSGMDDVVNIKNSLFKKLAKGSYKYNFFTKKIVKKNGKTKERFICTTACKKPTRYESGVEQFHSIVKGIFFAITDFDDSMLGIGKGVKDSVQYFDADFDKIIKLDFKNFFNNVSNFQVEKGLIHCSKIKDPKLLRTLSLIVCPVYEEDGKKKRRVWQGLSTSSVAAYAALKPAFDKVKELSIAKTGNTPVMYIDDFALAFKGSWKEGNELKERIIEIFVKDGFKMNRDKSKLLFGNKKFFLGINMDRKELGYNSYRAKLKPAINNLYQTMFFTPKNGESRKCNIDLVSNQANIEFATKALISGVDKYAINRYERNAYEALNAEFLKIQGKMEYLRFMNPETYKEFMKHPKYGQYYSKLRKIFFGRYIIN